MLNSVKDDFACLFIGIICSSNWCCCYCYWFSSKFRGFIKLSNFSSRIFFFLLRNEEPVYSPLLSIKLERPPVIKGCWSASIIFDSFWHSLSVRLLKGVSIRYIWSNTRFLLTDCSIWRIFCIIPYQNTWFKLLSYLSKVVVRVIRVRQLIYITCCIVLHLHLLAWRGRLLENLLTDQIAIRKQRMLHIVGLFNTSERLICNWIVIIRVLVNLSQERV